MTKQSLEIAWELDPFNERVEILVKELELATKWQRPCILLVVYTSEYVRADVENALENYLIDLGQKTTSLRTKNRNASDIIPFLREFKNPADTVFFLDGLGWDNSDESKVYTALNLQREFFAEKGVRVIFWLTQSEIINLAHHAPDFWAYRDRVVEFSESPKAEQVLQGMLESAWQGIGEYADQFEDTDARICLQETLLTELPLDDEASSTRAHLLLTLGVLNWRKGDYEKADEQLKEALRISAKLQDNWFEAQCFNAVALVKTSMERIGDAIDAYKQAIRLAPKQIFAWNNLGNLCSKIGRDDEAIIAFLKALECNPKDPIAWNGLGNVYYKRSYIDDAIAAFRKSIHFMPTFSHPWNGLGDVYASSGRLNEAIKTYRKAIELNRLYITPWLGLGLLFTGQGQYREAIKAYEGALKLDPRNRTTWNDLGMVHLKGESYDEAIDAFSKAIEIDHGNGWAYSNLAFAYSQQGKYEEAVPLYLKSIDFMKDDKDKAISWNRLADIYRLLNDYNNAIAAYQTADILERGTSADRIIEGLNDSAVVSSVQKADPMIVAEINEPARDLAILQEIIRPTIESEEKPIGEIAEQKVTDAPFWIFNPQPDDQAEISSMTNQQVQKSREADHQAQPINEVSRESKGDVMTKPLSSDLHLIKKNTIASKIADDELAETKPDNNMNAIAWNEKGNIHFKQGAFSDAIKAYNKAIQLDPSFGWPYSNLALTYLTQRQYAEAILLFQKSIALLSSAKDKAISWNGLGNAYRCITDYPNAVAAYQKAAELDPETAGMRDGTDIFRVGQQPRNAQAWNDLGELLFKTGAYDEAINAFNKAIELEPNNGWLYNNLARVLAARGQYLEAIPLYNKSIDLLQENNDKAVVLNHLGNAYRKLNDYDSAINAYQNALTLTHEGVSLLTRARFSLLSNCYADK